MVAPQVAMVGDMVFEGAGADFTVDQGVAARHFAIVAIRGMDLVLRGQ